MPHDDPIEPDPTDIDALIDRVRGTPEAKKRAKVVLRSMLGMMLDKEACRELGVSQSELEALRRDGMSGILTGLLPDSAEN